MHLSFLLGLRVKIIVAFFVVSAAISIALAVVAYQLLENKLFAQLQVQVGTAGKLGALTINRNALKNLLLILPRARSPKEIEVIENSTDYALVSKELNAIRNIQPDIIRYVYVLYPSRDHRSAKYLVDADVLRDKRGKYAADTISHFSSMLDMTDSPKFSEAISEKQTTVEDTLTYDKIFKINSLSGFSPILDTEGQTVLGVLGLDMAAIAIESALADVTRKSIVIAVSALALSLLISIFTGVIFTNGIIYLDHVVRKFSDKDFKVRSNLKSRDEVGRLSISFNNMAQTIEEYNAHRETILSAYGRFVPHDFLTLLKKESILSVNLGDQVQIELAVLFSDIRAFTTISESMTPKQTFDFLNDHLKRVGPEIRSHNGIIDKYMGDAVMALFPTNSEDALRAAVVMQQHVRDHNASRLERGELAMQIGVGIHYGRVMLGTIGEDQRMDGTVISDTVNLASRLEGLTRQYGASVIISHAVLERLPDIGKYTCRYIDKVRVVGKKEPVSIYEVCDAEGERRLQKKQASLQTYNQAMKLYYAQNLKEARDLFVCIQEEDPDDNVAPMYMGRIERFMASGIPSDWDGVEESFQK